MANQLAFETNANSPPHEILRKECWLNTRDLRFANSLDGGNQIAVLMGHNTAQVQDELVLVNSGEDGG